MGKALFCWVFLLLFLGGCAPLVEKDAAQLVKPSVQGVVQPVDPFVARVLNASSRVHNVQYSYSLLPNLNTEVVTLVGAKSRAELDHGIEVRPYSVIYADAVKREAFGVCEYGGYESCKPLGKVTALVYDEVKPVTPYDWLLRIPSSARVVGTESIDRQDTNIVEFVDGSQTVRVWVYDFSLLPAKVTIAEDDVVVQTWVYAIIRVGGFKDKDVLPRS
ncbi:MAG: hypothetical protein Q7R56_00055 [Nanoarchaeota archaeon]|nr:hypothetical protein [Nanoarchaeota archaeon]